VILAGKRLLITGVITKDSIAFHAAEQAQNEGKQLKGQCRRHGLSIGRAF